MLVSHILQEKGREVLSIVVDATLLDASKLLTRHRIGALVVKNGQGGIAGIVSERDIVRALAEHGDGALALTIQARMTREVATCCESDTIDEIMETMTRCRFRHMPVITAGELVGIVSIGDVVKTRIAETLREAQALREYIATG